MKKFSNQKRGFIQITLIVIGALVILKYAYDIDVVGFLTTGKFKVWLDKFYSLGSAGWEKYNDLIMKVWDYLANFVKNNIVAKIK